jgi:hypothetical protein
LETSLNLTLLPETLAVVRLPPEESIPEWARPGDLLALVWTRVELSVVCAERFVPPELIAERGWRGMRVEGTLDFALLGVLASLAQPLAEAGVSIFSISTYNTDYIMVKQVMLEHAIEALQLAGHVVCNPESMG